MAKYSNKLLAFRKNTFKLSFCIFGILFRYNVIGIEDQIILFFRNSESDPVENGWITFCYRIPIPKLRKPFHQNPIRRNRILKSFHRNPNRPKGPGQTGSSPPSLSSSSSTRSSILSGSFIRIENQLSLVG